MPDIPVPLVAASAALFAPLTAWLAGQRSRSPLLWGMFGALLGPVAAALLVIAPPGHCPACGASTRGWSRTCASCGLTYGQLGAGRRQTSESAAAIAAAAPGGPERVAEPEPTIAQPASGRVTVSRRRRATDVEPPPLTILPASARTAARSSSRTETRSTERPPKSGLAAGSLTGRSSRASGAAQAAPRADAPAARDWHPRAPATTLGRRLAPSSEPDEMPIGEGSGSVAAEGTPTGALVAPAPSILGSGIHLGGGQGLEAGGRYLLARVGFELEFLGPIHVSPETVADVVDLRAVEVTVVGDRLIIGGASDQSIGIVFGGLSIPSGLDLEDALSRLPAGQEVSTG